MLRYGRDILERFQQLNLVNLLRENDTLKPPALNELSTLLTAASETTKLYDIEIEKLAKRLETMREERAQVQKQADIGKSCAAPVRRLPTETLSEIFKFACWDGFGRETPASFDVFSTALAVSSVCASWRTIAIGTPVIWGDLITTCVNTHGMFEFTFVPLPLSTHFVSMLHERVRGAVLSLPFLSKRFNFDVFEPVLSQVVHCEVMRPDSHDELEEFLRAMPNLVECSIDGWGSGPDSYEQDLSPLTPHLRRVRISAVKIGLPWSQLQGLSIYYINVKAVLSILPYCSTLEHLILTIFLLHDSERLEVLNHPQASITLPTLLSLALPQKLLENHFLDVLELPSLTSLSIIDGNDSPTDLHSSIFSLLKRSLCPLGRLLTKRIMFHPSSLVQLLEESPSLIQLEYVCDDPKVLAGDRDIEEEATYSVATVYNDTKSEVGLSKELALRFREQILKSPQEADILVNMLISRWKRPGNSPQPLSPVGSVKSMRVDIPCINLTRSHWDLLHSLRELGVIIQVTDQFGDVGTRFEAQAST